MVQYLQTRSGNSPRVTLPTLWNSTATWNLKVSYRQNSDSALMIGWLGWLYYVTNVSPGKLLDSHLLLVTTNINISHFILNIYLEVMSVSSVREHSRVGWLGAWSGSERWCLMLWRHCIQSYFGGLFLLTITTWPGGQWMGASSLESNSGKTPDYSY